MAERVRQRRNRLGVLTIASVLVATVAVVAVGDEPVDAADETSRYVPVGPLRLADTRESPCGCTRTDARTIEIDVAGHPSIPDDVTAVAITVTATATDANGYVTAYPGDMERPLAATLNTRADRNVSNSAIVPVGGDGTIAIYQRARGELVVDVTGAFVPAATAAAGRYVAMPSRRLLDTRTSGGALTPSGEVTVPLPAGVSADASAVVVNVASVGVTRPGYLSARPAGSAPGTTAFMTVDGTGLAVSNAAIVPVTSAGFTIRSKRAGHVIVDVVGWFTGPSATTSGDGLFVALDPQRLHDTREQLPRIWPEGTIEVPTPGFTDAAAIVTNVAVTRADRRTYVTAHPARTVRPSTATLNAAFHDHTIANFAVTPISEHGLAYYGKGGVDVVVDATGYFTGESTAATTGRAPNTEPHSRVMIVGDSTLRGVSVSPGALAALGDVDAIIDGASCRRLLRPSCRSWDDGSFPPSAVEAITAVPGRLDIVVVKTGYNDWFSDFPGEFDAVVSAARAKGAHTIVWLTYNETVARPRSRQAYHENNVDLRHLAALPQYRDVLLADWFHYSDARQDWFYDGTHVSPTGAVALGDYIARWIAAVEHRRCQRPWMVGAPVPNPCPIPERIGAVPDPSSLY